MKIIDVRPTSYGKVVDVQLDNADLSFSMPYDEYCQLERSGELTEETAIESNIRFMENIKTMHVMEPATSGAQADAVYGQADLQPDRRIVRREIILAAFREEPISKSQANELFVELAEIDQSLGIHPSDTLQARISAAWELMDEIIF